MAIWSGLGSVGSAAGATAAAAVVVVGGVMGMRLMNQEPAPTDVTSIETPAQNGSTTDAPDATNDAAKAEPLEEAAPKALPSFDLVRVDADGTTLVAGQAKPRSTVSIRIDGSEVHRADTDGGGSFAAFFSVEPSQTPRVVSLMMEISGQDPVKSKATVILQPVAPQPKPEPKPEPVQVAETTETPTVEPLTGNSTATDSDDDPAPDSTEIAALVQPELEIPAQSGTTADKPVVSGVTETPNAEAPAEVASAPTTTASPSLITDAPQATDNTVSTDAAPSAGDTAAPLTIATAPPADEPQETEIVATTVETPTVEPVEIVETPVEAVETVETVETTEIVDAPATTVEPADEPLVIATKDTSAETIAPSQGDTAVVTQAETPQKETPQAETETVTAETPETTVKVEPAVEIAETVEPETPESPEKTETTELVESETPTNDAPTIEPTVVENTLTEPKQPSSEPVIEVAALDPANDVPETPVLEALTTPSAPPLPEQSNISVGSEPAMGAPSLNTGETAVSLSSTPAGETAAPVQSAPAAPSVLLTDDTGIRVLQTGGDAPAVTQTVIIDTITYDPTGEVALGGRGAGQEFVRVYLNNQPIKTTRIGIDGQWRTPLPEVDTGVYTLRVDQVDEAGQVTSRMETPFKREEPEVVAALDTRNDETKEDTGVITVQPGNTLWGIATDKYGDGLLYVRVYEANRERIRNPDLIYPGQLFEIPE